MKPTRLRRVSSEIRPKLPHGFVVGVCLLTLVDVSHRRVEVAFELSAQMHTASPPFGESLWVYPTVAIGCWFDFAPFEAI